MNDQEQSVIKLEVSERMLMGFKEKYKAENLPAPTDKDGYKFLKDGIAELKGHWIANEKFRDSMVRPLNEKIREFNKVCKDMDAELHEIALPMQTLKKEEDNRLAEIKREEEQEDQRRIAAIHARLDVIRNSPLNLMNESAEKIAQHISDLRLVDPEHDFDEFTNTASEIVDSAMTKLEELHQRAVDAEEVAKLKAEQDEKDRVEQEKQDKIDKEKREAEEEQRRKDQAELEALRQDKAKREAERLAEEAVPVEQIEKAETLQPISESEGIELVDDLNNEIDAIEELKLDTAEAIAEITEDSGVAYKVMVAIYTGRIPNVKWLG